jgi:hypothetical protein
VRALPIAPGFRPAAAAAVLALGVDVLYLVVLAAQNDQTGSREVFVSGSLAASAALALGSALLPPAYRAGALAWSAATLAGWGVLGLLSIGLLLLPAAALAIVALGSGLESGRAAGLAAAAGTAAALLTVVAGLAWTS